MRLAARTSLAGGRARAEVVQDLIRDLFVKRAHGGQYLRDSAHPDMDRISSAARSIDIP